MDFKKIKRKEITMKSFSAENAVQRHERVMRIKAQVANGTYVVGGRGYQIALKKVILAAQLEHNQLN